jgi:predicted transcriptional regulator of viral defense system
MKTKHTILSEKELNLLENLIAKYGNIIDFQKFYGEVKTFLSRQEAANLAAKLKKNGWLVQIKKGVYAITSLASHGFTDISPFVIARTFVNNSYVSFEAAMSYYNLFDQMVRSIISVTPLKPRLFDFQNLNYRFVKIKEEFFYGFKDVDFEGYKSQIAELEKIFLDYLYFRNDSYSLNIFWEKINLGRNKIDFGKMVEYAMNYPITTKRKLGFLLDRLGENTQILIDSLHKKGYSRLTKNSRKFNNKWRIYYEDRFDYTPSA